MNVDIIKTENNQLVPVHHVPYRDCEENRQNAKAEWCENNCRCVYHDKMKGDVYKVDDKYYRVVAN